MQINNDRQFQPVFGACIHDNEVLKTAITKARYSEQLLFTNIVKRMENVQDELFFTLTTQTEKLRGDSLYKPLKKLILSLVCNYKDKSQTRVKISEGVFEQGTRLEDNKCFNNALERINRYLRFLYPRRKTINNKNDNIIIDTRIKFPPETIEEAESGNDVKQIHKDLIPFSEAFHDTEMFDERNDIIEQYHTKYDIEDVDLADNLLPEARNINYINHHNEEHNHTTEFSIINPYKKKEKNVLPENFPLFALDYVRELSLEEANKIYTTILRKRIKNYGEFTSSAIAMLKKYPLKEVLSNLSQSLLLKIDFAQNRFFSDFNPKLSAFLEKYPTKRNAVTSKNSFEIESFDEYGAKFFDKLYQKTNDIEKAEFIYELCRGRNLGSGIKSGFRKIDTEMAAKALANSDKPLDEIAEIIYS